MSRRRVLLLLLAAAAALTATTQPAPAGPVCAAITGLTTWTGSAGDGRWATAANWSAGVPTSTSNACIPVGTATIVVDAPATTGALEAHAPIQIAGGSLALTDATVTSSTDATFRLTEGTLDGPAMLSVRGTAAFLWDGPSTMSGSGRTQIESGATLAIRGAPGPRTLAAGRNLYILGQATWSGAGVDLAMARDDPTGALVYLRGTLTVTGDHVLGDNNARTGLLNVVAGGTLTKPDAGEVRVEVLTDNDGTISTGPGRLVLERGVSGVTPENAPVEVANNLTTPWDVVPMPDGRLLISERSGRIRTIGPDGVLRPEIAFTDPSLNLTIRRFQGLVMHPDWEDNGFLYLHETYEQSLALYSRVVRLRDDGTTLTLDRVVIDGIPADLSHDGGRMGFGPDGKLYLTVGDAHRPATPRDPTSLNGKILRFEAPGDATDGQPAAGNPFAQLGGDARFVYSMGHRHPQGLAWDSAGRLWESEHGPSSEDYAPPGATCCRDELNLIVPGGDYGWPDVAGDQTLAGTRPPVAQSGDRVWAPGDLAFAADGRLYMPALLGQHIRVFELDGPNVVNQYALFQGTYGRLRAGVADGDTLLFTTDQGTASELYRMQLGSAQPGGGQRHTLIGGRYVASGGGELVIPGLDVVTNAADVILDGLGSELSDGAADALRNLEAVAAGGRLALRNGHARTTAGDLANAGTLSLASTTSLRVAGDYTQSGTLETGVGGSSPGRQVGHLEVDGTAALAGGLTTNLVTGSSATSVRLAEVLSATATSGCFSTLTTTFNVRCTADRVTLATSTIHVGDVNAPEGDAGTTEQRFRVWLDAPASRSVTVKYVTANSTATAGSDYTARASTTLTFTPGQTVKEVAVPVIGDTSREGDETFLLKLSSPSTNAVLADTSATGTVSDEEGLPGAYVSEAWRAEGNAGQSTLEFRVTLSGPPPPGKTATVKYATSNINASSSTDYSARSGTLSFDSATSERVVAVPINGDATVEGNETFRVKLSSPVNAAVADLEGIGTIVNDDGTPGASPRTPVHVRDARVSEAGGPAAFAVSLGAAPSAQVTVSVATADGTATASSDYTPLGSTVLTWNPGDPLTKTVNVPIADDQTKEATETFSLSLSSPSAGAIVADAAASGAIVADDGRLFGTVADAAVYEQEGVVRFPVALSAAPAPGQTVGLTVATTGGSATPGGDYTALAPTPLTFTAATGAVQTVAIPVSGDATSEPNESITLTLSAASGLVIADSAGSAVLANDD